MKSFQIRVFSTLSKQLSVSLIAFVVFRALFFLFNRRFFDLISPSEYAKILFYGLRFDISGLALINIPLIALMTFPIPFIYSSRGKIILFWIYVITNGLAAFFNGIDIGYYQFTFKRSTSDLLPLLFMANDIPILTVQIVKDFWFLVLLLFSSIAAFALSFRAISLPVPPPEKNKKFYILQSAAFLVATGLLIISIRGGLQLKPINLIAAGKIVGAENVPLAVNTPFTILKTLNKEYLKEVKYYSEKELAEKYSPIHDYSKDAIQFKRMNVVIIIMESFGKEYMGKPFGEEGLTPFLDSLAQKGLFLDSAFANGKTSMEAIPSITASLPSLMENPFISSAYSTDKIISLASILGKEGYTTSFFHGGRTGTLNFDSFARMAGFQNYYGLEDYNNKKDYDGKWGIYDGPFFQYFAKKLNENSQPFFASIFSLSSHHPYQLPESYVGKFPEGKHPIFKTVRYADEALREFFETASKTAWFNNTLFVITADHSAQSFSAFYKGRAGAYAIPIIFYCPSDEKLKGVFSSASQQMDILPSVLDYLNYDKPFFSFGESVFSPEYRGFAIIYREGVYQLIKDGYCLQFNGKNTVGLYYYLDPEQRKNNLMNNPDQARRKNEMEDLCKSFVQVYINNIIKNTMTETGAGTENNEKTK